METIRNAIIAKIVSPSITEEKLEKIAQVINGSIAAEESITGFLSDREACQYAGGIAHSTLACWRSKGLKSYLVGRRRLYRPADLDKFIMGIHGGGK
jgi:DNA-binding MarR family transcriptional regulator